MNDASSLERCMEDAATSHCLLEQSIVFTGNQTNEFLRLDLPDDTLSHLRCAPGTAIVWDNADGAPASGVNVVRLQLDQGEEVVVEDCVVETRVAGDPETGHPTSVQLFFARHFGLDPDSASDVTIRGGSFRTAYTGSSSIALGCNCNGPTRWTIEDVHAEGPIALDAKGRSWDGSPLPWSVTNSTLVARDYTQGTPRCWKQLHDVAFVDLSGTTCVGGQLQFSKILSNASPQHHDLDGLTLRDVPIATNASGALIAIADPHSLSGTLTIAGAPGTGDPGDDRSHNLILGDTMGAIELRVEFSDCHRVFSHERLDDFALDLRPGGQIGSIEIDLVGPGDCPTPPQLFDHQFDVGSDFLNGDSRTVNAIGESLVNGYARTNRIESSFRLVDGQVVPDSTIIPLLAGRQASAPPTLVAPDAAPESSSSVGSSTAERARIQAHTGADTAGRVELLSRGPVAVPAAPVAALGAIAGAVIAVARALHRRSQRSR
ncbi:MAG: hypothetical protein ACQGVC_02940 [Myxococcota bacterium]